MLIVTGTVRRTCFAWEVRHLSGARGVTFSGRER